ncbi:MAG: hypothetical protein QOH77_495 [Actinomycetota bacterium]|nr:hypothetical protein [Actinomycetota bacterium]
MWANGMGGRQLATLIALYLRAKDARSALVVPLTPRPETMVPGTVDGAPATFFGQTLAGAGALTLGAAATGFAATAFAFGAGAFAFDAVTDAVFTVTRTIALVLLAARCALTPETGTARTTGCAFELDRVTTTVVFAAAALDAAASDAAEVVGADAAAVVPLRIPTANAAAADVSTTDDERSTLLPDAYPGALATELAPPRNGTPTAIVKATPVANKTDCLNTCVPPYNVAPSPRDWRAMPS